jgi:RNA polymerase sigma-70 factor (ECF subfamily)
VATDRTTSLTLLQRACARDEPSWQRLVELYKPLVYYWCGHWGVYGADADDIQQDVFQAVAAGLPNFGRDYAGSTFRGWLKGITRHKLLDSFQKERPIAAGGSDALRQLREVPGPDSALPDVPATELLSLYHRALQVLHSEFETKTWQAFWKAAVDDVPIAEIASSMGMTQAAVRKAKSRVLRRLREELGDIIEQPEKPA